MPDADRPLLARGQHERELRAYLDRRLPRFATVGDPSTWEARRADLRRRMLALLLRGHPAGVLEAPFAVRWRETLAPGHGYRVRKLVYEGYPGLWVPALLYEPAARRPRAIPAVLNPDGHHLGGKAMAYKQARCINLARRGMRALSFEFLGQGELSASRLHNRLAHLGLYGIEGTGVFYLVMKRALDVLVGIPATDPARVAMTGLSGGGWQTLLLSALDERITASIPVAGHTAIWQRVAHPEDWGDMEQVPADIATVADYDTLSAMIAPRPALFIYNHADDCCFPTRRARVSVLRPALRAYRDLGAGDRIETHDNRDPGTHNYGPDNRARLYRFLDRRFGTEGPPGDLPWAREALGERDLTVGVPEDSRTLLSLAAAAARRAPRRAAAVRGGDARERAALRRVLHWAPASVTAARRTSAARDGTDRRERWVLSVDGPWSLPAILVSPDGAPRRPRPPADDPAAALESGDVFRGGEVVLAVSDRGRAAALAMARACCACAADGGARRPRLVAAVDVLGTGEQRMPWERHMLLAGAGERPLGLQAAQIAALAGWLATRARAPRVVLLADGPCLSVAALAAAAVSPGRFAALVTNALPASLETLVTWPVEYEAAPSLFCFGLLPRFDVPALLGQCRGVRVRDLNRGPLPWGPGEVTP